MTARERYAALAAKMNANPACPLLALTPAEREEYARLSRRFGAAGHDSAVARRMGV